MCIFPYPTNNLDSFFGLRTITIQCVNWVDPSNDGYPIGSHFYPTPYESNDILLALMFLRFYYILQTMIVWSPPNNRLIGKRVCHEQGIPTDFSYQLKTAFKERPYLLFCVTAMFTVLAMAFLIRIFERPYYQFNFPDTPFQYFAGWPSAIWYIIITMSSVGYGDMVAVTPIGRIVTLMATLIGVIFLSVMVAIITNSL